MNSVLIALAALIGICSLGLNVIQYFTLQLHIHRAEQQRKHLISKLARTSMFVVRVQQADELYQASVKDGYQ